MRHVFWSGKDNTSAFELHDDDVNRAQDQYDAIARIAIRFRPTFSGGADVLLDSLTSPGAIEWGGAIGRKVVVRGEHLTLAPGAYRARVIAYAVDYPNGVVFADFPEYDVIIRD